MESAVRCLHSRPPAEFPTSHCVLLSRILSHTVDVLSQILSHSTVLPLSFLSHPASIISLDAHAHPTHTTTAIPYHAPHLCTFVDRLYQHVLTTPFSSALMTVKLRPSVDRDNAGWKV